MKTAPQQWLAGLVCGLGLWVQTADASDTDSRTSFGERFRAAAVQPDAAALADLSALPFLYEGRRLDRAAFMREAVPALFTPAVRRCLQRATTQRDGDRLVLWCKPYGFYLGPVRNQWRLIEFAADVD